MTGAGVLGTGQPLRPNPPAAPSVEKLPRAALHFFAHPRVMESEELHMTLLLFLHCHLRLDTQEHLHLDTQENLHLDMQEGGAAQSRQIGLHMNTWAELFHPLIARFHPPSPDLGTGTIPLPL